MQDGNPTPWWTNLGLIEDAPLLAEAVVDTVRESLLLLDPNLKVILANRSFYLTFHVKPAETLDWMVYELGTGQWNIPRLRELLENILPNNQSFSDYEVTHTFPHIGRKVMLLNARKLRRREDQADLILLAIEDVTALSERETELRQLVREKEALTQEVHHRVKNNLQTIASLLSLHSGYTDNAEVKEALDEAGARVQAIARLHEKLYASANLAEINFGEYLRSITHEIRAAHGRPEITFTVIAEDIVLDVNRATALGLMANELIVNCLKHAFPESRSGDVIISFQHVPESGPRLARLTIGDNGVGVRSELKIESLQSMGLELVRLLSEQLGAHCDFNTVKGVQCAITFRCAESE